MLARISEFPEFNSRTRSGPRQSRIPFYLQLNRPSIAQAASGAGGPLHTKKLAKETHAASKTLHAGHVGAPVSLQCRSLLEAGRQLESNGLLRSPFRLNHTKRRKTTKFLSVDDVPASRQTRGHRAPIPGRNGGRRLHRSRLSHSGACFPRSSRRRNPPAMPPIAAPGAAPLRRVAGDRAANRSHCHPRPTLHHMRLRRIIRLRVTVVRVGGIGVARIKSLWCTAPL